MVSEIDKVTRVLEIYPMECTVAGPLSTNPFLWLFVTSALTLDITACLFSK